MAKEVTNWSGSLCFTPKQLVHPKNEKEIAKAVAKAAKEGRNARVTGARHSSSPLIETEDTLISLDKLQGLVSHKREAGEATIYAGMKVHDAGQALYKVGLAMHNTGDVDVQNVSGAIGTGTHGTGKKLQNLSTMLIGARLITASGDIIDKHIEDDPEFIRALRTSMGMLGIFSQIRLKLQPAFKLHRREWCTHIEQCMEHLEDLKEKNRNFDFYWYPRSDLAKLRTMNEPDQDIGDIPYATLVKDEEGWSHEILPRERSLKFDEMEYALPAENGPACFEAVRKRVKEKHRKHVGWRVLYRTIAPDDAYLSPYHSGDSVTISLHHNAGLPFWDYFKDIEPIFLEHGGRPHWGKKHTLTAKELQPLYPDWDKFLKVRQEMDPNGVFLTPYMRRLMGIE